jgi:hypothetical protein
MARVRALAPSARGRCLSPFPSRLESTATLDAKICGA